jgi:hypothetical protein
VIVLLLLLLLLYIDAAVVNGSVRIGFSLKRGVLNGVEVHRVTLTIQHTLACQVRAWRYYLCYAWLMQSIVSQQQQC